MIRCLINNVTEEEKQGHEYEEPFEMDLYLGNVRSRYKKAHKKEKGEIIAELCVISGYHKKHAIRMLNKGNRREKVRKESRCRLKIYQDQVFLEPLKQVWLATDQLFGYERFGNQAAIELMNDVYKNEISLMNNYFLPNTKLKEKQRVEAKILKKHDKPATPYQRLMRSEYISQEKKQSLTAMYEKINPFELKKYIQKKVDKIFSLTVRFNGKNVL